MLLLGCSDLQPTDALATPLSAISMEEVLRQAGPQPLPPPPQDAVWHVGTRHELIVALARAREGQLIRVADKARIDLTGLHNLAIPGGVTLTGAGGLLFVERFTDAAPLFHVRDDDVRISGLRFQGPGAEHDGVEVSGARGIRVSADTIIENCTLNNWSYAAIDVQHATGVRPVIRRNHIHDCWGPLGYGIEVGKGNPLITGNVFARCRHAIAGIGQKHCSYEACANVVLSGRPGCHSFDMHSNWEHNDRRRIVSFLYPAGSLIRIRHNIFADPRGAAVVIRGRPRRMSSIAGNWFVHESTAQAVRQKYRTGNLLLEHNVTGTSIPP